MHDVLVDYSEVSFGGGIMSCILCGRRRGCIPTYLCTYDTCTESQMGKPGLAYRRALNDD